MYVCDSTEAMYVYHSTDFSFGRITVLIWNRFKTEINFKRGPVAVSRGYDPWLQNGLFPPLSGGLKPHEIAQNERMYGNPSGSASSNVLESSPANGWPKWVNNCLA